MSDTPETEAQPSRTVWFGTDCGEVEVVRKDFAEALELQLAEARADVVAAAGDLMVPIPDPGSDMARVMAANGIMRRERDEARRERDALREALTNLDSILPGNGPTAHPLIQAARAALASVKGGTLEK